MKILEFLRDLPIRGILYTVLDSFKLAKPIQETILEALRLAVLGFVSNVLLAVVVEPQTASVVILTILLKVIDKYLHKSGIADKGLVRF